MVLNSDVFIASKANVLDVRPKFSPAPPASDSACKLDVIGI